MLDKFVVSRFRFLNITELLRPSIFLGLLLLFFKADYIFGLGDF